MSISADALDRFSALLHKARVKPSAVFDLARELGISIPAGLEDEKRLTPIRAALDPVVAALRSELADSEQPPTPRS